MIESTAIDPIIQKIARDPRIGPTGVRLYLLLRDGGDLQTASTILDRSTDWLKRYERQLRRLGYLQVLRGARAHDIYVFSDPEATEKTS